MLRLRPSSRADLGRLAFEAVVFFAAAGLIALSIYKPGHITRQMDLMTAGALVVLYMLSRPSVPLGIVAAVVVFVPAYALPPIGIFPGSPPALVCLLVVLVLTLTPRRHRSRTLMTPLDWMTGVVMLLMLVSVITGVRGITEWVQDAIQWLAPFACGRMLGLTSAVRYRLARVLVIAGTCLSPIVLIEAVTSWNPFITYLNGNPDYGYSSNLIRAGVARADASFGQPIALSMFLATAIILAIALILDAQSSRERRRWSLACGMLVVAQFATVSRTAWLMLAVGLIYAALTLPDPRARRRLQAALAGGLVVLVLIGQFAPPSVSSGIPLVGQANSETRSSSTYRSGLLRVALQDHGFRAFGTTLSTLDDKVDAGYGSVDNEYLELIDRFGLVPGLALLAMFPALALMAFLYRPRRNLDAMYVATALGSFVAIATVAFITQQQVIFWLIAGVVSALFASRRVLSPDGALLSYP